MTTREKLRDKLENPIAMRKFHGWSTAIWFIISFPTCILLSSSIPFVVFISLYAIVIGHFSSWQAARTEVKQDEQNDS